MTDKIPYNKPPCSNDELLAQLINRGLIIEDLERAKRYLNFISYYRLSAYFLPYQSEKDHFQTGSKFDDILDLYVFDRRLKLILMEGIERIEVGVKSAITNYMSLKYNNPHWFLDEVHFDNYSPEKEKSFQNFNSYITSINNSLKTHKDTTSIRHYYSKYSSPSYPPSWAIMEILTFGQISKIYSILQTKHKRNIAKQFKTSWQVLESILYSLTVIRNKCAHHQRIWNVKILYPPSNTVLKKIAPKYEASSNSPCVAYFMIWFILKKMNSNSTWNTRLCEQLFDLDESLFHKIGLNVDIIYNALME